MAKNANKFDPKKQRVFSSIEDELCDEDLLLLTEHEEELFRRGNFEIVYPLRANVDYYEKFFESHRYNNLLVWAWLRGGAPLAPITKTFKKIYSSVV
jgi:hypothetical protein